MPAIKFQYRDHVTQAMDGKVITAKLGTAPTDDFNTYRDVSTPFKMDTTQDSTFIPCADGDEIEGFIYALNEKVLYDQRKVGSIQTEWFRMVDISGAHNVGDLVVADAAGGVKVGAPADYKWRIMAVLGLNPNTGNPRVTVKKV